MSCDVLLIVPFKGVIERDSIAEVMGTNLVIKNGLMMTETLYHFLQNQGYPDREQWFLLPSSSLVNDVGGFFLGSDQMSHSFTQLLKHKKEISSLGSNGSFACLKSDDEGVKIANDFFGFYNVYYHQAPQAIYVSNSLKRLRSLLNLVPDQEAIEEYMNLGFNYSCRTVYSEIKCLPPASVLSVSKNGRVNVSLYDTFSIESEYKPSSKDFEDELRGVLTESISKIYREDLKYSLSMTGGMDSRLIYLNWPDKVKLLTETAGDGTSDFLKAREIVSRLGNPDLHVLEDLKEDSWTTGFAAYYDKCDNPLKAFDQFNYDHLMWKVSRGSDIHLSGVGGELLDGENLYMSRRPSYIIKESLRGYRYSSVHNADKATLIGNVVGCKADSFQERYLDFRQELTPRQALENIVSLLDTYLGKTKYAECYVERFRTYMLAVAGYNMSGLLNLGTYHNIMPFNDKKLIQCIVKYHPSTRELRKLTIRLLQKDTLLRDIPTDTTHLPINYPYRIQRFMRAVRMVANIGFQKKIPLLQKGAAPKFRAFPYFLPENAEFRAYMREVILKASVFDKAKVTQFLNETEKIDSYNFYIKHGAEGTLLKLYRLAIALPA